MTNPTPARRPRRWWKALAAFVVLAFATLAALPWLLATGPARSRVAAGLNRALAPGRLQFDTLGLSWFGPTRLGRVTLLDPKGETVARVDSAVLDQTLGQLLLDHRRPSLLTLVGASLDVRRSVDGSINLAEALRTIIANPDPRRDLTIRIVDGSLEYRDPFLAEPSTSDALDLTLRIPAAPNPVTWSLKLGQGNSNLEVHGDFDRWLSKGGPPRAPELQVGVVSKQWPIKARTAGLDATGRLDGSLDFSRRRGRWVLSGDARLDGLDARGKILAGDNLALDRVEAGWDLAESEEGWTIRRLSFVSPLGDLKAEGRLNGPGGSGRQRIEGRVDLAAIARQLPRALRLRDGLTVDRGSARIAVDLAHELGRSSCEIEAKVSDLAARDRDRPLNLRDPATFSARIIRQGDDSSVERLAVKTPFLDASAKGSLQDGVNLEATIDLAGFREQLGDWVDLGKLDLAGRARVTATYRARGAEYATTLRSTLQDFRVGGLDAGPIRRDSINVLAGSSGPAEASGWPSGWSKANLSVQSGTSAGEVEFETKPTSTGMVATASTPLGEGDRSRLARARLSGDWSADGRSLAIDDASISLNPVKGGPDSSGIATHARGKLDLSAGTLILEPAPSPSTDSIAIDPEGIRVSGFDQGLGSIRFDGGISGDLETIDRLQSDLGGRPPLGLSGRWSVLANALGDADGVQVAGKFGLVETPDAIERPARPTSMALRAHYSPGSDRLDLSEFTVSTAYGTLDASGRLDDATGRCQVDLKGTLAPDFRAINALLVRKVEPGASLEGRPRGFRATGTLGDPARFGWKGLDAEFGFDLAGADVYGMKFGPAPVVLRAKGGKLGFDPISTTLNEGHVRLEPEVDLDAPGGPTLRLAKNSTIREARINDEVSKRVLAYVAPVLDRATRASGLVSVDLDHAEFPIGPGRGRQAKVEGVVLFQDVEFAPGPLANDILSVVGRRDMTLKLDRPITLTIADGRINQRGMEIPIGDLTRIELAGWVDFDRNLSVIATLPVTPAMLGNNPMLSDIAAGTRVRLPIGGTLDRPSIDRDAFASNLQEMGKSLLTRGATRGAMELLMRLARPKDPNAPPPPPRLTPEERKAMRQEKKAIRRGEIPPPGPESPPR